jgi:CubicO group peptidase (beta-lactamase class C family)
LGIRPASALPDEQRAPLTGGAVGRELDRYLGKLADADAFSGVVLLAKDGAPVYQEAFGPASRESGAMNRVDTRFNLGSMNKMMTAVAVARLAEAGQVRYDAPVSTYLPDYPRAVAERITLHQLLTHTAGLGDFFGPRFFSGGKDTLRSVSDYLALFIDDPLLFEPGTDWRYSNAGFVVLGAIVEAVTGQDYYTHVRDQIYEPAGMTGTEAFYRDETVPNLATGYTISLPPNPADLTVAHAAAPPTPNTDTLPLRGGPAGGGYSTAPDLLRFARALTDGRLLRPETVDLLLTGKVAVPVNLAERYGYGFIESQANGTRVVGHGGGAPGVSAGLELYLELGYTAVVVSNRDGIARDVLGKIGEWLTGR